MIRSGADAFFPPGSTIVRRDLFRGKLWSALATRVVRDEPGELVVACRPGAEALSSTAYIDFQRTGDGATRERILENLAAGTWELAPRAWHTRTVLTFYLPGEYFSVWLFFDASGRPEYWYVNFELPYQRTGIGIDSFDLALDLVAAPDLSGWTWKDEDEYAQARRLGIVSDRQYRDMEAARHRAVAMLEAAAGPFDRHWLDWRPDPAWPTLRLPPDTLGAPSPLPV